MTKVTSPRAWLRKGYDMDINFVPQGWQCPICKRVYSPTTPMCNYCGGEQKTVATTSGPVVAISFDELKKLNEKGDY